MMGCEYARRSETSGRLLFCRVGYWRPPWRRHRSAALASHGQKHPQETGFLNRTIELHGVPTTSRSICPEEWRRDDHKQWPIILFLHGRGERGSEGMWQTQIGLPSEVRDHPERWPFIIVMPQCPQATTGPTPT